MYYADTLGLPHVLERVRHYRDLTGDASWEPSALLVRLAEEGKTFAEFK